MIRVCGRNDDIVVIEGSAYEFNEIGCFGSEVRIWFTDGTVILVSYEGCWCIKVESQGAAEQKRGLDISNGWADVFCIDAEIETHEVIDRRA